MWPAAGQWGGCWAAISDVLCCPAQPTEGRLSHLGSAVTGTVGPRRQAQLEGEASLKHRAEVSRGNLGL